MHFQNMHKYAIYKQICTLYLSICIRVKIQSYANQNMHKICTKCAKNGPRGMFLLHLYAFICKNVQKCAIYVSMKFICKNMHPSLCWWILCYKAWVFNTADSDCQWAEGSGSCSVSALHQDRAAGAGLNAYGAAYAADARSASESRAWFKIPVIPGPGWRLSWCPLPMETIIECIEGIELIITSLLSRVSNHVARSARRLFKSRHYL